MIEILSGHTSPNTAVVIDDYPYGFRLRCKIRYWLEYHPKRGFRFVSQTTNPRKPFGTLDLTTGKATEPWNKPKASTYTRGPAVITRDTDNGHIHWLSLHFAYTPLGQLEEALVNWRSSLPAEFIPEFEKFIRVKREYERLKSGGEDFQVATFRSSLSEAKGELK